MTSQQARCAKLAAAKSGSPVWHAFLSAEENADRTFAERGIDTQAARIHWSTDPVFAALVLASYEALTSREGWEADYE